MLSHPTAAVTGAYGYVGSHIRAALDADGWHTIALVRRPRTNDCATAWKLGDALPAAVIGRTDALVHCAYDFTPRTRHAIWAVNVEGTSVLLRSAAEARTRRLLVISSMSAYSGTPQVYGQAKLAIEELTLRLGGVAIRPGLVYGQHPGGIVGALLGLRRLPVVPVVGGRYCQYPVFDDDLAAAVVGLLRAPDWTPRTVTVAQPEPMRFIDILNALMSAHGRKPHFVPVPWRPVYWLLRLIECMHFRLPLRADSVLGLVYQPPCAPIWESSPDLPNVMRRL